MTQFLQEDVRKLNQTVVSEQQRNAVLETRVAALETKLANTVASLAEINGDLKMTKNLTYALSSDLRDGNQNATLMSDRLHILNATFLTAIESLEKATDLLKDNLTSVIIASSKPTKNSTFFSYRNLNTSLPFTVGQPLIFTGRISSSDPNYDPTTGIFTASIDGVYLLSTTLAADTNDHLTCYIMRNDVDYLAEIHSSAYNAYSSASTTIVVDAKVGDQLFVGRCSGNGKLSSYKSSFSGVLVH
ncbi:uncharacterized protein LOC128223538 [Mya arenaria]|nr:uncharacterized protein LOC128223538 [Mya arenaria]